MARRKKLVLRNIINAEAYVIEGVRDILRKKLLIANEQCECEYDEQIPAIVNDLHFAVIGAGTEQGPTHSKSGGVHDLLHSVQVLVLRRQLVARDQRRSLFLERLFGINSEIDRVIQAIDWQNDLMSYVNALMYVDFPTAQPFITTLRIRSIDPKPRMVNSEIYNGVSIGGKGTTPYVAMARSVYFSQMRRIQTVTQLTPDDVVIVEEEDIEGEEEE